MRETCDIVEPRRRAQQRRRQRVGFATQRGRIVASSASLTPGRTSAA